MFEFVSATRSSLAEFRSTSPLAKSLERLLAVDDRVTARITFDNTNGLSTLYNRAIATTKAEYLIFLHDDLWLDDYYVLDRVAEGLERFDVVGLAGTAIFEPETLIWYKLKQGRSGAVAHGNAPFGEIKRFGPASAECLVLDGVFLAAKTARLRESGVRFDERFAFHFYDLDFCFTARASGLKLGTWPIAMTHQSGGFFGSEAWLAASQSFVEKWKGHVPR